VKQAVILAVAAIMIGLFALDRFLATMEQNELASEARSHYEAGKQLLAAGRSAEAVDQLQRARALVRNNRDYQLTLAQAQIAAGRLSEAEANLRSLLDHDSNNGPTNLTMARLMVRSGDAPEAEAYYHRALYGTWPPGTSNKGVRMELVDFLATEGAHKELLPELLLLQDESGGQPSVDEKLARLFLKAGSPARAANIYRALIRQNHNDLEAYKGLAQTELAQGDFRTAQTSFLEALRRAPGDQTLIKLLHFTSILSNLDPTPRRLPSREKFDRSNRILEMAEAELADCGQPGLHSDVAALIAQSSKLRAEKVKGGVTNEMSEARLGFAERLWQERISMCGQPPDPDDPLPLLMHKLTQ
jgi:tetratricopeptide (TPR) repeat protein